MIRNEPTDFASWIAAVLVGAMRLHIATSSSFLVDTIEIGLRALGIDPDPFALDTLDTSLVEIDLVVVATGSDEEHARFWFRRV